MSDMRFVIIGIVLVFAGFVILGIFGDQFKAATIESNEFGTCYEYFNDKPPMEINCSFKVFDQTVFFGIIIGFLGAGVISLVKGVKGDWDNKINPEDVVGPNRKQSDESENE